VVQPEEQQSLRDDLVEVLRRFTPEVEPGTADAALFWLNAAGLERLYPTLGTWAGALQSAIEERGLVCSVAVGFTRFGTYATAKSRRTITIFEGEDQEQAASLRAPVGVLPLGHEVLLRFHQLGILTIRDFTRFSPGALRRRFGREVESLQRFARGEEALPVQPAGEHTLMVREMRLLYPEASAEALLHHVRTMMDELIAQAWAHQEGIAEIVVALCPEQWPGQTEECLEESLRAARPSCDKGIWERLLVLRFEKLTIPAPVIRLAVEARTVASEREQTELFAGPPRRDPRKALAAIADVCAELGNDAVQIAELDDAHLPEEQFRWSRVTRLAPPRPRGDALHSPSRSGSPVRTPLVRRLLHEAVPLSRIPDEQNSPRLSGPYVLSGGWWQSPYRREYYYLEDVSGRLLWIYYDEPQRRWLVQGVVE
jgi:protein ImuB